MLRANCITMDGSENLRQLFDYGTLSNTMHAYSTLKEEIRYCTRHNNYYTCGNNGDIIMLS